MGRGGEFEERPLRGANFEFEFSPNMRPEVAKCSNGAATVQQLYGPKTFASESKDRFMIGVLYNQP
jgi:hypothetical protein